MTVAFTASCRTLLFACAALASTAAHAQEANTPWPERVVRIVNPYAAGGPSDTIVRLLANGLSSELGQRFIVENKAGAGTVIGANLVAKSQADGYTLLLATVAPLVVQPAINTALPYDAGRDFDVKLTHVPYPGAAPAVLGVPGGDVQVSFVNITPQLQHVKAGKLRPIAIGSRNRSSLLPDVPTMDEAGLPGYVSESWNGLAAPGGTPRPVVDKLYRAMAKVMANPEVRDTLATLGADATVMGPDEFKAYVKADELQLVPLIRSLGLTPSN